MEQIQPCEDDFKPPKEEEKDMDFPKFEAAPKKVDDSRMIMPRGGKKNKKKGGGQWATFNPNKLPEHDVDLNALYR